MTPEQIRVAGFEPHTWGDPAPYPPDALLNLLYADGYQPKGAVLTIAEGWGPVDGNQRCWVKIVGHRLACPHARRVIAAKDAEIARLREAGGTVLDAWDGLNQTQLSASAIGLEARKSVDEGYGLHLKLAVREFRKLLENTNG